MIHQTSPSPLLPSVANFGIVIAGQNSARRAGVTNAFSGSQVTASIEADTSGGSFQIIGLTTYDIQEVDPTELPPGHQGPPPVQLITISHVDGTGPISTAAASFVAVDVAFTASQAPTAFQYTATAVLRDENGNSESIPIIASVAGIKTTQVGAPPVIRQGEEGDIQIQTTSINAQGPGALVYYSLASSTPSSIQAVGDWDIASISPGASISKTLRVAIGGLVPAGLLSIPVIEDAFFGAGQSSANQQYDQVTPALQVQVAAGVVLVYPAIGFAELSGRQASVVEGNIVVTSDGQQLNPVNLTISQVPAGVAASLPMSTAVPLGSQVPIILKIAQDAPTGQNMPVVINWVASDGQSGTLTIPLTIKVGVIVWHTGLVSAGEVVGWAEVALVWNGDSSYHGHLHDDSKIIGDSFTFVMAPRFNDGTLHVFRKDGDLGSALVGPTTIDWQDDSNDPWIKENWDAIVSQGFNWSLSTSASAQQIGDLIVTIVGAIGLGVAAAFGKIRWTRDDTGNGAVEVDLSGNDQQGN